MYSKLLGGILLIVGTSIGAGILGLPIAAAELGFLGAFILLLIFWLIMLISALLILEVNVLLPSNNNLISMAKKTIGLPGQLFAWVTYLLLLYSLLCAYIAGGSDLLHYLITRSHIEIPHAVSAILFTFLFGLIVYAGIHMVDKTNRLLIALKFLSLLLLLFFLFPYISKERLIEGNFLQLGSISALTVTSTAFGWAALIPSLRTYFSNDIKMLRKAILIGSLVPLICYIAWDIAIMGVIPLYGEQSLTTILNSPQPTSSLITILSKAAAQKASNTMLIKLFSSISVLTSFLGVSLCLIDFLADGLRLEKKGVNNIILHLLTFIPAIVVAIYFPGVFIKALQYAGLYCVMLLIFLPGWMAWCARYRCKLASQFTLPGGKPLLALILVFSASLMLYIIIDIFL